MKGDLNLHRGQKQQSALTMSSGKVREKKWRTIVLKEKFLNLKKPYKKLRFCDSKWYSFLLLNTVV